MMPAAILSLLVKTEGATAAAAELNAVDTAGRKAAGGLAKTEAASVKTSSSLHGAAKSAIAFGAAFGAFKGIEKAVSTTDDLAKTVIGLERNFGLTTKAAGEWAATAKARDIDTKQLNMSFKTLSKQVQSAEGGGKAAVQQFKALGISQKDLAKHSNDLNWVLGHVSDGLKSMPAGTERAATAGTLFGRAWQKLAPLLRGGSTAMNDQLGLADKYGAVIGGKGVGAAEKMIQAQRESKLAFLGLQVTIGTTVIPVLTKLIAALAQVVNWFRQHATETKALGAVLIAATAVMVTFKAATLAVTVATQAATIAAKLWAAATWAATNAAKLWAAATWLLNIAMDANPIALVVIGIAALVAAFVVAYKKSETFRNIINGLWGVLKAVFTWVSANWPLLLTILTGPFGLAAAIIIKHFGAIKGAISAAFNWIKGNWPLLLAVLTGPFGLAVLEIAKHAGDIKNGVINAFHAIINAIRGMAGALVGLGSWTIARIVDGIHSAAGALLNAAGWIKDQIVRAMHALVASPVALGSWFVGRFVDGIKNVGDAIRNAAKWLVDKVVGAVKGFLGISSPSKVFEDIGRNMMKGLINGMGAGDVMKFVAKHLGGLVSKATGVVGNLLGVGGGGGSGPAQGLGKKLAGSRGWGSGTEWWALNQLIMSESGWDPNARNPKSGAFGIGQALPPTKMPLAAQRGDAASQIQWTLDYIAGRYGDPIKAWDFHVAHGYYARGGKVPGQGSGDSVPIMATPGEFVIRKSVVDKFGPTFFAALNGYKDGGQVGSFGLANLVDSKFGLHTTSGYRSPQHNAAIGGAPHSWHTRGTPSNPGAIDLVGPMSQMRAALAWVKANVSGLAEAMIDNYAGLGWNLHIAGPGLMNFKGLAGGKSPTKKVTPKSNTKTKTPAPKAAPFHPSVNRTVNNPWIQAAISHIDNLVAAGQMDPIVGRDTQAQIWDNAVKSGQLRGENSLIAQGNARSLRMQNLTDITGASGGGGGAATGSDFYSVIEDRLSEIDAQVRAGDISAEAAQALKAQTIRENIGNPDLSARDVLNLRGELKDLTDATADAAAAAQAQTDAMNALKDELKRNNDFARSVTATELGTTMRALADFINGQIYGNYGQRSSTASAGSVARY